MAKKFTKAKCEQAFLKICGYGPSGRGKTFTTLLQAEGLVSGTKKRIAYIDTEHGTDFYAMDVKERQIHPKAFDFDAIHTRSVKDVWDAVLLLDPEEYGVIVIDSITHLWDSIQEAVKPEQRNSSGGIPLNLWGAVKKPYKNLEKFLLECDFHVFVLGRQKDTFEDDDGQLRKTGVSLRSEKETEYEYNITMRYDAKKGKDTANTTILAIVEKDRTGILAGRTFPNPNFETIKPVLKILNGTQAKFEDPSEVAEKDQELINGITPQQEKKSEDKYADFKSQLESAKTKQSLDDVATKVGKSRILIEDDKEALRGVYKVELKRIKK